MTAAPKDDCKIGQWHGGANHEIGGPTLGHALHAPSIKTGNKALSMLDSTSCTNMYYKLRELRVKEQWRAAFDSGKVVIESCANSFVGNADIAQYTFSEMDIAVQNLAYSDPSAYHEYGAWVRSVLYLNTKDPGYFCSAAIRLGNYFVADTDTTMARAYKTLNTGLAIDKWLWQNTECDSTGLKQEYNSTRLSHSGETYDTTLPTMAELGLDTLLAKHALYRQENHNVVHGLAAPVILSASANPNPTGNGTVLTFGMSQAAYVRIEVFDVLGNAARDGRATRTFEEYLGAGNHSVPLDMSTLASGTYYARLTTAYGETRTVKIIKQ
jgi:hypothetical protein